MALLNWNVRYSIGVDKMDDQHKQLMAMLNSTF